MIKIRLIAHCDSGGCSARAEFEAELPLVLTTSNAATPRGWRYLRAPHRAEVQLFCSGHSAQLLGEGWERAVTPDDARASGAI